MLAFEDALSENTKEPAKKEGDSNIPGTRYTIVYGMFINYF